MVTRCVVSQVCLRCFQWRTQEVSVAESKALLEGVMAKRRDDMPLHEDCPGPDGGYYARGSARWFTNASHAVQR